MTYTAEVKKYIDDLGTTFEDFKSANDERLKKLEKGENVIDLEEKIKQINTKLDEFSGLKEQFEELEKKSNRIRNSGDGDAEAEEYKEAFYKFFRKGGAHEDGLRELETKALNTQVDTDGGYTVPVEVDTAITRVLGDIGVMRSLARVQTVGSATFKRLVNMGGATSGWVGETEDRIETSTPTLREQEFPVMEMYAEPHATQAVLEDTSFDVEGWLSDEVSIEFTEQESAAFISGGGVKKPRGILSYPTVDNDSYQFGSIGFVKSGANGAFAASDPSDKLIDLVHSLKRGYRSNAVWLMNDLTVATVRKLKDADGNYLWKPGLEMDRPNSILGYRQETDDFMPDIAANSFAIAFGDFRRGYIITDRQGTRVLRDPFTRKPYVKFYTTKRVGGGVQDFAAIKLMKFAA